MLSTGQPAISRVESADYQNWSFNTLRRIAEAMDARIRVIIEPAEDVLAEYDEPAPPPPKTISLEDSNVAARPPSTLSFQYARYHCRAMTEITWPTPFGYTIFCDDIRHEVSGKTTLVGVYRGQLKVLGALPAAIPRLVLSIHYFEKSDEVDVPLELRVSLPGDAPDSPSQRLQIPPRVYPEVAPLPGEDRRAAMNFEIQFTPLVIKETGSIRVRMHREMT